MTDDITRLPDNLIGLDDQKKLESYGAHAISHGWATRYCWSNDKQNNPQFEIYRGGANEVLAARIIRHRIEDEFIAEDAEGVKIAAGTLGHVMFKLDQSLTTAHENQPPPA